jgi:DNA-binding transcriptional LysR family regulator
VARRIAPFGGKLVASPDYLAKHGTPRTVDELLEHATINRINDTWPLIQDGKTITVHPRNTRFTADNGAALVPAALAGIGIALLPNFLINEHLESGALVAVMPDHPMPEAGVYVVRPPGGSASCKVRALIDIMVERSGDKQCSQPAPPAG